MFVVAGVSGKTGKVVAETLLSHDEDVPASKLPDLLLFAPHRGEDGARGDLPTHARTPDGEEMSVFGEGLATEVGRRYRAPVQMMQLNHGIFDEASISVIAVDTVHESDDSRVCGDRFPSRKTSGWAASSHSERNRR